VVAATAATIASGNRHRRASHSRLAMIHAVLAFLHGDHSLDITGLFEYPLLGSGKLTMRP
jgi:hypothetical protein